MNLGPLGPLGPKNRKDSLCMPRVGANQEIRSQSSQSSHCKKTLAPAKREAERMVEHAQRHMIFGCKNPNHDTDCQRYLDFSLNEVAAITQEIEAAQ